MRMDIRVINPCPDEVAKLKAAGLAVADVEAKGAFAKSVGPAMLQGVPILFGYNARPDMPEDAVYKMIKAFYEKRDELVKLDPGFTPMAKDFVGMQVQGINANPQIPVHAGLAKFLKEHKAWNDKWKVAAGGPRSFDLATRRGEFDACARSARRRPPRNRYGCKRRYRRTRSSARGDACRAKRSRNMPRSII